MPALILANLPGSKISYDSYLLPLIPLVIGIVSFYVSRYVSHFMNLETKTRGVFVISSLILNTAFILPFIVLFFGSEGLSRILIFDIGNVLVIFGLGYYQACKFGNHEITNMQILKRFAAAIPLWAILFALLLNYLNISLKGPVYNFAKLAGDLTIPLLLISVGVFFEPRVVKFKAMFISLFLRIGFGLILGIIIVNLLGLEGITKKVAIIGTATPIGYNTLIFASLENLDKEFAAALVSTSILISMIYLPLLIYLIN
jgi:predicted permease